MTNGYLQLYPPHGTDAVSPPTAEDASAKTLQMQYDEAQARSAAIEAKLDQALKREDTGVHKVNTEALEAALVAEYAKAARGVWKRIRNWALGAVGFVAAGGGGFATWQANTHHEPIVEAVDVLQTVENEAHALEGKVQENRELAETANRNVRTLGREVIRRDDARAVQLDFISDKLDEISPKAKRVKVPPGVQKRRAKKKQEALDGRVDDLFGPSEEEDKR